MTTLDPHTSADELPRWSVTDLHESFDARSFVDAMDRTAADVTRLEALFDEHDIRAIAPRPVTAADGAAADAVIAAINAFRDELRARWRRTSTRPRAPTATTSAPRR